MSPLRSQSLPKKKHKKNTFGKKRVVKKKVSQEAKRPVVPYPYLHLGFGFLFTALFFGGIVFMSGKLLSFAEAAKLARGQLVALQDYERALSKLTLDLRAVSQEVTLIDRALPDEEGIVYFVKLFREISREVEIEVFDFGSDQPSLDSAGNYYVDLSVELKGKFDELNQFLDQFAKLPYLIDLQIVDIINANREEAVMVVTARIYVDDLFFQEE